jgi:protein-S-isoprenylcysteine O-methyltransferase Ste14
MTTMPDVERVFALDETKLRTNVRILQFIVLLFSALVCAEFVLFVVFGRMFLDVWMMSLYAAMIIWLTAYTIWSWRQMERIRSTVHQQQLVLTRHGTIRYDRHNVPNGAAFRTTTQVRFFFLFCLPISPPHPANPEKQYNTV